MANATSPRLQPMSCQRSVLAAQSQLSCQSPRRHSLNGPRAWIRQRSGAKHLRCCLCARRGCLRLDMDTTTSRDLQPIHPHFLLPSILLCCPRVAPGAAPSHKSRGVDNCKACTTASPTLSAVAERFRRRRDEWNQHTWRHALIALPPEHPPFRSLLQSAGLPVLQNRCLPHPAARLLVADLSIIQATCKVPAAR